MKNNHFVMRCITVILCSLSFFLHMVAHSSPESEEADHDALRKIKAVFEEAANTNNIEIMRGYLDHPFSVVTYTNREFTDFDKFKAQWEKTRLELLGEKGTYSVKLLPVRSILMGDIAIARGDSENHLRTDDGEKFVFSSQWTVIFHKVNGEWKIVHSHSSIDPFGNPMLKAGVKKLIIKIGLIVGIVTLFFGFFVGMRVGKRRQKKIALS